jgi:hypothetical protein
MGIKPEDILNDDTDSVLINGVTVRKGTIGAFIFNIDILEDPTTTEGQKKSAKREMKQLAPAIIAVGLYKHVSFNNLIAKNILDDAAR